MNNNPVKMLFDLSDTAVDVMNNYASKGILLTEEKKMLTRMQLCSICNSFDAKQARCKLCGCFMKVKVRLDVSRCPIGKW